MDPRGEAACVGTRSLWPNLFMDLHPEMFETYTSETKESFRADHRLRRARASLKTPPVRVHSQRRHLPALVSELDPNLGTANDLETVALQLPNDQAHRVAAFPPLSAVRSVLWSTPSL